MKSFCCLDKETSHFAVWAIQFKKILQENKLFYKKRMNTDCSTKLDTILKCGYYNGNINCSYF